jgi:hypothetical protein
MAGAIGSSTGLVVRAASAGGFEWLDALVMRLGGLDTRCRSVRRSRMADLYAAAPVVIVEN